MCHYAAITSSIWKHFMISALCTWAIVSSPNHILWLLFCLLLIILVILPLSFNIHWWLRPNSVFRWCRRRFLRTWTLFTTCSHNLLATLACHQIVVLLYKAKWIWWWSNAVPSVYAAFASSWHTLGIRTSWTLLSCSRTQTAALRLAWTEAALSSFICFLRPMVRTDSFPTCQHLATWVSHSLKRINLIFKGRSSYRSTRFEYPKLLLIEYLWVGKALVPTGWAEMWGTHHLLGHHQIILLWPIHSLRTLNAPHSISASLRPSNSSYASNASNPRIAGGVSILLNRPWSIRIFVWNFRAISLEAHHSSANSHYCLLVSSCIWMKALTWSLTSRSWSWGARHIGALPLISKPSSHHIGGLRSSSSYILSVHYNVIFLDDSGPAYLMIFWTTASLLCPSMVLLSLNDMTAKHLWILNFNLRIVKDVIVVINILDYFNWLLLTFLLWLWWVVPSLMLDAMRLVWVGKCFSLGTTSIILIALVALISA